MSKEYINEIYKVGFPDDAPLPDDLMRLCLSFIAEPVIKYYANGEKRIEFNYYNNKKHGVQKCWHFDGGLKSEEIYYHGERHGIQKYFYEDRSRRESHYIGGKICGRSSVWHANGNLIYKIYHENELKHGSSTWYCENGELDREDIFEHGVLTYRYSS